MIYSLYGRRGRREIVLLDHAARLHQRPVMPAVSESLGMRPMALEWRKGGAGFESLAGS
jgi:hypothetical protein